MLRWVHVFIFLTTMHIISAVTLHIKDFMRDIFMMYDEVYATLKSLGNLSIGKCNYSYIRFWLHVNDTVWNVPKFREKQNTVACQEIYLAYA